VVSLKIDKHGNEELGRAMNEAPLYYAIHWLIPCRSTALVGFFMSLSLGKLTTQQSGMGVASEKS